MPPGQSQRAQKLKDEAEDGELPYISKSRMKTFVTCPRQFYIKYIVGFPTEDNYHLKKGRHLHETFEVFYEKMEQARRGEKKLDDLVPLIDYIPLRGDLFWAPFTEHVTNFLKFEARRMENSYGLEDYMPQSVEEEMWLDNPPVEGSPPWYGYTDLIVNSWTIPEVGEDSGVSIVDFKTGKVPDPQYRDEGIHLENTFYSIIARELGYNVTGLVGYYPQEDVVLTTEPNFEMEMKVMDSIEEMVNIESPDDAPKDEQPLCKWSSDEGDCCDFYADQPMAPWDGPETGQCDSQWGRVDGPGPTYD